MGGQRWGLLLLDPLLACIIVEEHFSCFSFQGYCVSVNLVKRLTSDILLSRLKQFGNRHADHTRALSKLVSFMLALF